MTEMIALISVISTLFVVFLGSFVSWNIAKRKIDSILKATDKQIIAPMRQDWINNLRDLIAELLAKTLYYFGDGFEDRSDAEYLRLSELEIKISLMLNVKEKDHKRLRDYIRKLSSSLGSGREGDSIFVDLHPKMEKLAQKILKKEWNRVRKEIRSS